MRADETLEATTTLEGFIPLALVKEHNLGGGYVYPDTGCKVSPRCAPDFDQNNDPIPGTGCPLAECVFDAPLPGTALRAWQGDSWRAQAQALLASGAKRIEIQRQLGLSRSTIYRSLRTA